MAVYEVVGEIHEGRDASAASGVPGIERGAGRRVRVVADDPPDAAVEALFAAGARRMEVREYPDSAARAAWSDWDGPRDEAALGFRRELAHLTGGRARGVVPLLAAGMIALALEQLGVLVWPAAVALFVLLAFFVVATELKRARERVAYVRYVRESETG